uniref:rRNA N-glycosylase n=1 Tax=Opuntia streptacantha TaxID=393608 RepID=A0A7C8Z4T6_OPUST
MDTNERMEMEMHKGTERWRYRELQQRGRCCWWHSYEKLNMRVMIASAVAMLAWVMLMFATTSSGITKPKIDAKETVEFRLNSGAEGYTQLIKDLREKLKDPKQSYCQVPMLQKFDAKKYIYVKLLSEQNSITLAIRKSTIYLLGYSYEYDKKLCARFFTDTNKQEWKEIFGDQIANRGRENIGYSSGYSAIEKTAELAAEGRKRLMLGMTILGSRIDKISKTACTAAYPKSFAKTEAELLLIAIQMVSEAVRFKYIENQIKAKIPNDFYPAEEVIWLEEHWGFLSEGIAKGTLMGLLNSVNPSKSPKASKWLTTQLDDNVTVWTQ